MKYILVFIILTVTFNVNGKSLTKNEHSFREELSCDSLTQKQEEKSRSVIDIILETDNFKLYGDTSIEKDKISYASFKFEPYISFDDFKVRLIDNRKYAELDLKSNKGANYFRTRLREAYNTDTANFAGHYTFVFWGCGSPCQSSMLIDRKTGKIYDAPEASLGYDFKVNSRMLIVNPTDSDGFYDDCAYCKPIIYIFDERTKTFKERKPK